LSKLDSCLRIALTPGEPAGIGPDLAIMLAQQASNYELVAFADPDLINQRASALKLPITLRHVNLTEKAKPLAPGELAIKPVALAKPSKPGDLNTANAQYVLDCLDQAIAACTSHLCQAMVTGPVQKSIINDAGIHFSGHTEYLAEKTNRELVVMMLATEDLRVALATTHLPLTDVPAAINADMLKKTITIIHEDLQNKFGIAHPRLLVCGLNPHAGENGHLGKEEIDTIIPALETMKKQGINCIGPLPADTAFTPHHLDNVDAVLAMYHDQGLPVLKYKGFGQAVNITLGLPIIRTSVDHGTALDLAATGNIDCGSLQVAIDYALNMASATTNNYA
jgi:4-hydroxythreonine-4-phosphate dehydrogenase